MLDEPDFSRTERMRRLGLISIFSGLGIAVTGKMLFHADLVVYLGVLMNFLGMFLMVYPAVMPRRKVLPTTPVGRPAATIEKAETTRQLPSIEDTGFIPSVTEDTTGLLQPEGRSAVRVPRPLP